MMDVRDFDAWRVQYDNMSYQNQKDFYNLVEVDHPCQQAFNVDAYHGFFGHVARKVEYARVVEVGGWKGGLAMVMLDRWPNITDWYNVEICEYAMLKSICYSSRYEMLIPSDWMWNVPLPAAEVFVASHTIEHIKQHQLEALFDNLPAETRWLGLQAPIAEDAIDTDWTGYHGTHILEIGWKQISKSLDGRGFAPLWSMHRPDFRAFVRKVA